jgi:hypothetical protein
MMPSQETQYPKISRGFPQPFQTNFRTVGDECFRLHFSKTFFTNRPIVCRSEELKIRGKVYEEYSMHEALVRERPSSFFYYKNDLTYRYIRNYYEIIAQT